MALKKRLPFSKTVAKAKPKLIKIHCGDRNEAWELARRQCAWMKNGLLLPDPENFEQYEFPVRGADVFVFDAPFDRPQAIEFMKYLIREQGAIAVTVDAYSGEKLEDSLYGQRRE